MKKLRWRSRLRRQELEKKDDRFEISEGLVLAGVPVLGTTLALLFEAGFLSFYGIPLSFATLDISHIVRASLWTAVGVGAFFVVHLVMYEWNESSSLWRRLIGSSWPYFAISVYAVFMYPTIWWVIPISLSGALLVIAFYAWKWKRKNGKTLLVNVLRFLDLEREQLHSETRSTSLIRVVFSVAALLMMFASAVKFQGTRSAKEREEYWVLKNEPTLALVERYGDNAVFVRFDPSSRLISREIVLRKLSDAEVVLLRQNAGPLVLLPRVENTPSKEGAE